MYKIIDNFLPEHEFERLRDLLMSQHFPWYYNDYTVYHADVNDNIPQFIHYFVRIGGTMAGIPSSDFIDDLNPLLFNIPNLATVIRCKANLTLRNTENAVSGYHVDTSKPFDGYTSIFYLNDSDGGTIFGNGEIVECKANRFVTFGSSEEHSAITCTDQNRRIVINVNYTVWK